MSRILLISASFGGGHHVAAQRLSDRLNTTGFDTQVVDLLDLLPVGIGHVLRRGYRTQLAIAPQSWTWLCHLQESASGTAGFGARVAALAARRVRALCTDDTAAVVSTYPMASQLLGELRQNGTLGVPAVTVLTDMSVHPLWINPGIDAHIAVHPVAAQAARRLGARSVRVGGPIVPTTFRPAGPGEKQYARAAFGLPDDGPLALIAAGSWGVGQISRSAADVHRTGLATPVIACGRNRSGHYRLSAAGTGYPLGWTDDMPSLFRACDVVVQSGGGLSVQEALASGIPVVTYRPLPGHGQTNADALAQAGWAPWARDRDALGPALATALLQDRPLLHAGETAALIASVATGLPNGPQRRERVAVR